MVLSQNPRPVIRNPYAKPQAKRPRTHEPEEQRNTATAETSASAENKELSLVKTSSNEPPETVNLHCCGSGISTVVPPMPVAAPVGAPHLKHGQDSKEQTKPVINPYRRQLKRKHSSQCSPQYVNDSLGKSVPAAETPVAISSRAADLQLPEKPKQCDDQQNELDMSMDWTAAILEIGQAGAKKQSSPVQPRSSSIRSHPDNLACTTIEPNHRKGQDGQSGDVGNSQTFAPNHPEKESASCSGGRCENEFDSGLDWSAALQEIDGKSCAMQSGTPTHSIRPCVSATTTRPEKPVERHRCATSITSSPSLMKDPYTNSTQSSPQKELSSPSSSSSATSTSQSFASQYVDPLSSVANPKVEHDKKATDSSKPLGHDIRPSSWLPPVEAARPGSSNNFANTNVGMSSGIAMTQRATVANAAAVDGLSNAQQSLPPKLRYSQDRVQPVSDEYRQMLVKHANLSAPMLNGWTLYSHQKRAILKGLVMRRTILGLDMGMGKTLIGCVWSKAFMKTFSELRVYVICPVSLKREWKRTAEDATGLHVAEENQKEQDAGIHICSWAKIPTLESTENFKYVVVCDEAHGMQSLQSARTKNALKLILSKRCLGTLLLTGTPMKNGKPLNLFPLLKAVRHPFGDHQLAYEVHFCAGREKAYGNQRPVWDANGSSNLHQLNEHISSHLLHMTKEQCLKDLPPRTRHFRKVAVSSRSQLQHNNALNDLAQLYENRHHFENSNDVILGAVQRVRQIGSFAKIDATVALAKSVLEEEPAVVIFTSFVQVAQSVHKKLAESGWNGELLTGETQPKKRQGMVDNFQGGLSPVFVSTFGAGGVGLTLTAAHTIILVDRPWTPGDAHQAEDRVRRIGQTKPVKSIWMVAFDLDEQIDSVLEQKSQTSNTVLARGQEGNAASAPAPKISIFQLLRSVLPKKGNRRQAHGVINTTS